MRCVLRKLRWLYIATPLFLLCFAAGVACLIAEALVEFERWCIHVGNDWSRRLEDL